jgi:hypothetical protein
VLNEIAGKGGEGHQADGGREHGDESEGRVLKQRGRRTGIDDYAGGVFEKDAEVCGKTLHREGAEHRERKDAAR